MRSRLVNPGPGRDIDGRERLGLRYIYDCERPSCKYNEIHLPGDYDTMVDMYNERKK